MRLKKAQPMSRPFRFVISVSQDRDFEITGWGDDAPDALRDAVCSNTTSLGNHFSMGDRAGFRRDELCIEDDDQPGGSGYRVSFHPRDTANGDQAREPETAWAIRALVCAV